MRKRSKMYLFRAFALYGGVTALMVGLITLFAGIVKMVASDHQLCLTAVLFSTVSSVIVYLVFVAGCDRKAAHSAGKVVHADRRGSYTALGILLFAGIAVSVIAPLAGFGKHMYAAVIEVVFSFAMAAVSYISMKNFLPDGVE